jgi:hypothetical protein
MKQASYSIALISELKIAVYDLQLHGNKLPSTIYNSTAINCRLQSTTPRLKIAAGSLQNCSRKMMQKILPNQQIIPAENTAANSLLFSIQLKMLPTILVYSAENTTFNSSLFSSKCYQQSLSIQQKIPPSILVYSAQNTTNNPYLFSRKCHLQFQSTQHKILPSIHIYSAENAGGK